MSAIKTWQERLPAPFQRKCCTMNCSLPAGDPRMKQDVMADCPDCDWATVLGDDRAARDAEIAELRAALVNAEQQIEISDRDIMEEWDRYYLGHPGEPFLQKVVHFARHWMKGGYVVGKRRGATPLMPLAVRRFVRVQGFLDGTAYVEYSQGHAYAVRKDGAKMPCSTPLHRAELFVREGDWREIIPEVAENQPIGGEEVASYTPAHHPV